MPRRDERFLGPRGRARARVRERRRRVLTVLLESIGLTGLIGAVPPLRGMWMVTAALLGVLVFYVYLLLQLRAAGAPKVRTAAAPATANGHAGNGHAGNGHEPSEDERLVLALPEAEMEERRRARVG